MPGQCVRDDAHERIRIRWIDRDADRAVRQRVGAAVAVAADDLEAARRRLEEDDAEPLLAARHDEDIGQAVIVGELARLDHPGKHHPILDAKRTRQRREPCAIFTLAGDEIHDIGTGLDECRQRRDDTVVSLAALKWVEPSDGQQHLLAAKAMPVEEVIRFGARREAGIDRIGKHPHARRIGTVQREKTPPREPAHGGNQACTVRGPALPRRRRSPRLDAMQLQPQRSAQISGDDSRERGKVKMTAEHDVVRPFAARGAKSRQPVGELAVSCRQLPHARRQRGLRAAEPR